MEISNDQQLQMQHGKTIQRQLNIDSRSVPIQSDIKTLRGKDCEVENIIKFLKEIEIFVEIKKLLVAVEISILVAYYSR